MKEMYFKEERPEMLQLLPINYSKVLEIGCGEGSFISSLKENSEKWGVEPNTGIADSNKKYFYKSINSTFENCYDSLPDNYFDLVICNDVIEHFKDHDKFFELIKAKMESNSYLIGAVLRKCCNVFNK